MRWTLANGAKSETKISLIRLLRLLTWYHKVFTGDPQLLKVTITLEWQKKEYYKLGVSSWLPYLLWYALQKKMVDFSSYWQSVAGVWNSCLKDQASRSYICICAHIGSWLWFHRRRFKVYCMCKKPKFFGGKPQMQ